MLIWMSLSLPKRTWVLDISYKIIYIITCFKQHAKQMHIQRNMCIYNCDIDITVIKDIVHNLYYHSSISLSLKKSLYKVQVVCYSVRHVYILNDLKVQVIVNTYTHGIFNRHTKPNTNSQKCTIVLFLNGSHQTGALLWLLHKPIQ